MIAMNIHCTMVCNGAKERLTTPQLCADWYQNVSQRQNASSKNAEPERKESGIMTCSIHGLEINK
jgi:hypothetical protein